MKTFCFTVDDNIRCLKEITEKGCKSIFEHPYLAMYKRLHEEFDLKVQLNLFYRTEGFDLSSMTSSLYSEWKKNADWLKLSFHSDHENVKPYEFSEYDEVFGDCKSVNDQILRFASPDALAETTTIHFCLATSDGLKALAHNRVLGLLGLYGTEDDPRVSYGVDGEDAVKLREGETVKSGGITYGAIDIVLNCFSKEEILSNLKALTHRDSIRVMIHEQYFYSDYKFYQPDFEDKLRATFTYLTDGGYKSCHFQDLI